MKAIARDLHLSRKVVRKAIREPGVDFTYRRVVQPLPKLGPFQSRLDALLVEDEVRPRREKLRVTRIHDLLLREGFDGSYDAVRRYAARWRLERRRDVADTPAFIPLMFRPGEAYQFDWSHEDVEIAGKPMRVKVAHMRLCASRAIYVRAYPRETQEMLFDLQTRDHARRHDPPLRRRPGPSARRRNRWPRLRIPRTAWLSADLIYLMHSKIATRWRQPQRLLQVSSLLRATATTVRRRYLHGLGGERISGKASA